ncbi:hypothetical protein SHKM778_35580 [Streptomyces sp. KM77-8]|uniref:Helicase C-terminal domain-containing protein n=1 Tax=Streptomyces haneummycinicus TaxID=3074435 RepID=A0AAT9HI48_9ACTN
MHGGLSDEQQMQCVEDFGLQDTPVRILFTGDVASEGVNLHRQCHQLVHYDVPWSLIRIEQRNGRIDRYGQPHQPQFRALILTSAVDGAKDDTLVSERLLEREAEAHRSLGTAEAVSGLYRAEAEEKSLIQDLLRGRDVDESLDADRSSGGGDEAVGDFLADFFNPVNEELEEDADSGDGSGAVPRADVPRLFGSPREFLDEALREVYPDAHERLDLSIDAENGLLSFVPPSDLVHRLKALPPEYVREQGLRDRLKVTFNRRLADSSLTRARASATSSWPDISLLTDLHPVMEWLTDKVLVRLDRQEAPVLTADVSRPTYLVQGIYSNALGRPTVVKWMAVTTDGEVDDDMVAVLRRAQVGPTMANPDADHDTGRLAEAIPGVLDRAEAFLEQHREAWDEPLRAPIEEYKTRLGAWEQPTLAAGGGSAPTATRDRLTSLADSSSPPAGRCSASSPSSPRPTPPPDRHTQRLLTMTFDSLVNRGDYFSAHYLAEVLPKDLKSGLLAEWKQREEDAAGAERPEGALPVTPRAGLRALRRTYFAARSYFTMDEERAATGEDAVTYDAPEWRDRVRALNGEVLRALGSTRSRARSPSCVRISRTR